MGVLNGAADGNGGELRIAPVVAFDFKRQRSDGSFSRAVMIQNLAAGIQGCDFVQQLGRQRLAARDQVLARQNPTGFA